MRRPELSICIPLYEKARSLPRTLASLETQDLAKAEVIFVDNASTDESLSLVRAWARARRGVKIVRLPRTVSFSENWLLALSMGRGKYLKLLLAGDAVPAGALARQVTALDLDSRYGFSHGDTIALSENDHPVPIRSRFIERANFFRQGASGLVDLRSRARWFARQPLVNNLFGDPALVFRASLLHLLRKGIDRLGGAFETWADLELWLRLYAAVPSIHVGGAVSIFHEGAHRERDRAFHARAFDLQGAKFTSLWMLDPDLAAFRREVGALYETRLLLRHATRIARSRFFSERA